MKRALMKWKETKKDKEEYWAIRKKWKELLEEKRKKRKEEEEKDLRSIRNEAEEWKFINKKRGRKETRNEYKISGKEWRQYFMEMLNGKEEGEEEGEEGKEVKQEERKKERKEEGGQQEEAKVSRGIEEEDICKAVRRMKKEKAAGIDGIPMEAVIYGGKPIRKGIVELITKIWEAKRNRERV